jgi:type III pantothenate kinase
MAPTNQHCLVVDIGNTRSSAALVSARGVLRVGHVLTRDRDAAGIRRLVERILRGQKAAGVVLCSVVPGSNSLWRSALREALGIPAIVVSHRLNLGVSVDYPKPGTLGPDRLANVCAASVQPGPVIVADFGTAATFDVVTEHGVYVGGVIAPGPRLVADYLADRTALLPRISLRWRVSPVGRSTVGAMQIGAGVGYRGMVKEITLHLIKGLGVRRVRLLATGGYARWAVQGIGLPYKIDPALTLRGLRRIFELNGGSTPGR